MVLVNYMINIHAYFDQMTDTYYLIALLRLYFVRLTWVLNWKLCIMIVCFACWHQTNITAKLVNKAMCNHSFLYSIKSAYWFIRLCSFGNRQQTCVGLIKYDIQRENELKAINIIFQKSCEIRFSFSMVVFRHTRLM